MNVTITKHFQYSTPFSEADNDDDLEHIMRLKYPKACSNLERDAGFFARMVDEVKQFSAWRVIGFKSFEEFCTAKLGKTLEEVEQIMRGVRILEAQGKTEISRKAAVAADIAEAQSQSLPKLGEIGRGRAKRVRCANGTAIKRGQNRREYLATRIKRDHPDILARAEAGEFKSMRAAAIAAGIVKVKSPLEQLRHWWRKASESEREQFLIEP